MSVRGGDRGERDIKAFLHYNKGLVVAVVSLTDKPLRRDSSVEVLLACRAAPVNHCHSRHVLSASPRPC